MRPPYRGVCSRPRIGTRSRMTLAHPNSATRSRREWKSGRWGAPPHGHVRDARELEQVVVLEPRRQHRPVRREGDDGRARHVRHLPVSVRLHVPRVQRGRQTWVRGLPCHATSQHCGARTLPASRICVSPFSVAASSNWTAPESTRSPSWMPNLRCPNAAAHV